MCAGSPTTLQVLGTAFLTPQVIVLGPPIRWLCGGHLPPLLQEDPGLGRNQQPAGGHTARPLMSDTARI